MIEPDDEGGDEGDGREPWANFLHSWRIVEFFLDVCIMALFQRHGDQISDKTTPVSLERRVGFLKLAFSEVPELRSFEASALKTAKRIREHQSLRNDIVHGFPMKVEPDGTTHIVWPQLRKQKINYHLRVVTRRQWDSFAANNGAIIGGLLILYSGLHPEGLGLDESDQSPRELTVENFGSLPFSKRIGDLFNQLDASAADD